MRRTIPNPGPTPRRAAALVGAVAAWAAFAAPVAAASSDDPRFGPGPEHFDRWLGDDLGPAVADPTPAPDLGPAAVGWRRSVELEAGDAVSADLRRLTVEHDEAAGQVWFGVELAFTPPDGTQVIWNVSTDGDLSDTSGCAGSELSVYAERTGTTWEGRVLLTPDGCGASVSTAPVTFPDGATVRVAAPATAALAGSAMEVIVETRLAPDRRLDDAPDAVYRFSGFDQPFADVPPGTYFFDAVVWMLENGLTTGVGGSDRYEPFAPVDRAQLATVLWRTSGSPAAPPAPFPDVPRGAYFASAVDWLAAQGLTTGFGGSDRFEPFFGLDRAQMITFLWRSFGEPTGFGGHGFVDVPLGAYFEDALRWARATGLTTGVGGSDRFEPFAPVDRAQLATFLYRALR